MLIRAPFYLILSLFCSSDFEAALAPFRHQTHTFAHVRVCVCVLDGWLHKFGIEWTWLQWFVTIFAHLSIYRIPATTHHTQPHQMNGTMYNDISINSILIPHVFNEDVRFQCIPNTRGGCVHYSRDTYAGGKKRKKKCKNEIWTQIWCVLDIWLQLLFAFVCSSNERFNCFTSQTNNRIHMSAIHRY